MSLRQQEKELESLQAQLKCKQYVGLLIHMLGSMNGRLWKDSNFDSSMISLQGQQGKVNIYLKFSIFCW